MPDDSLMNNPEEIFQIVPSKNEKGSDIFSVLVKRTYRIEPDGIVIRSEKANSFLEVDLYWEDGDPTWSTVKYENDLSPYKLATDVVVIGKAYSPDNRPVSQMDVSAEVGRFKKTLRIIGDRHCIFKPDEPPLFTDPIPFTEMDIRYDRAYGGKDDKSLPDIEFHYPRNPMGTGIAIKNIKEVVEGLPLPNIEDPNDLLTPENIILGEPDNWNRQPLPQGLGWFQKTCYPRCSFVGAIPGFVDVDEVMREELLNWVPKHQIALSRQFKLPAFNVRFNNGASWGLIVPFLAGDETVRLTGLTVSGNLQFKLPGNKPGITLDIGMGENELTVVLHTVCIRLEEQEVDLIWRGAMEYPGIDWLPEMKRLNARVYSV